MDAVINKIYLRYSYSKFHFRIFQHVPIYNDFGHSSYNAKYYIELDHLHFDRIEIRLRKNLRAKEDFINSTNIFQIPVKKLLFCLPVKFTYLMYSRNNGPLLFHILSHTPLKFLPHKS